MASAIFLTVIGITMIFFYIRWDKRLKLQHDKEMEKLELEIAKLFKES